MLEQSQPNTQSGVQPSHSKKCSHNPAQVLRFARPYRKASYRHLLVPFSEAPENRALLAILGGSFQPHFCGSGATRARKSGAPPEKSGAFQNIASQRSLLRSIRKSLCCNHLYIYFFFRQNGLGFALIQAASGKEVTAIHGPSVDSARKETTCSQASPPGSHPTSPRVHTRPWPQFPVVSPSSGTMRGSRDALGKCGRGGQEKRARPVPRGFASGPPRPQETSAETRGRWPEFSLSSPESGHGTPRPVARIAPSPLAHRPGVCPDRPVRPSPGRPVLFHVAQSLVVARSPVARSPGRPVAQSPVVARSPGSPSDSTLLTPLLARPGIRLCSPRVACPQGGRRVGWFHSPAASPRQTPAHLVKRPHRRHACFACYPTRPQLP
jgi:hypothetical protein